MSDALPILNTAQDCARLAKRLGTGPVVALWATGQPRSTVDVMLQFRELLQQRKFKVVLLLRKSAVQNFSGLFSKINDDLVYEFNNNTLLEHCYFFSVLFTHDYCLSGKPKNFSGKIVFFPHNINCMYPTPRDVFADYVVAVNESYRKFDFSTYPNYIKINKNFNYTIIPAGYPKLDLVISGREKAGKGPHKRVAFVPVMSNYWREAYPGQLFKTYSEFISAFCEHFPEYEFIVRPYSTDRNSPLFRKLREKFSAQPRFRLSLEEDNTTYLFSCDLLLTDYSAVARNFCYAALRPVIWLQPTLQIREPYQKVDMGYVTCSAEQCLAAITEALNSCSQWEEHLRRRRAQEVRHAGETLSYLCDNLTNILLDSPPPDWIVLDKGDTPFDKPAAYLRLFARPLQDWARNAAPPPVVDWFASQHGANHKLALAALRCCLRAWPAKSAIPSDYIWRYVYFSQLQKACAMVLPRQHLGLLRHMHKKEPNNAAVLVWLAEALFRYEPESEELTCLCNKFINADLDQVLAGMAGKLLFMHGSTAADVLDILRSTDENPATLHPEQRLLYALLLLDQCCFEEAARFLEAWRGMVFTIPLALRFCLRLLHAAREKPLDMPHFFIAEGEYRVTFEGFDISFTSARQAAECLNPVIQDLEKKAPRDPDLWAACSKLHAACGRYESAGVCGWKAIRLAEVDINFLLWLTEVMKKNGDQDSALKCAAIAGSLIKKIRNHA